MWACVPAHICTQSRACSRARRWRQPMGHLRKGCGLQVVHWVIPRRPPSSDVPQTLRGFYSDMCLAPVFPHLRFTSLICSAAIYRVSEKHQGPGVMLGTQPYTQDKHNPAFTELTVLRGKQILNQQWHGWRIITEASGLKRKFRSYERT